MNDPLITSDAISVKVTFRFIILTFLLAMMYVSILLF